MTKRAYAPLCGTLCFVALSFAAMPSMAQEIGPQWVDPFPTTDTEMPAAGDALTLSEILVLVASSHPLLAAGKKRLVSASEAIFQAGRRPNPELELESDDIGGETGGFSNSALSVVLSQEFELFGKRRARQDAARAEQAAVDFGLRTVSFDIYLATKERFFDLLHAQEALLLSQDGLSLAEREAESAAHRVSEGAALRSEQLLAELEAERARLEVARITMQRDNARTALTSLWNGGDQSLVVSYPESALPELPEPDALLSMTNLNRESARLAREKDIVSALIELDRAEAKPSLSLSGGYRRSFAEETNTFAVGASMPLPFFNRNKGSIRALSAHSEALVLEQHGAQLEAAAELRGLVHRYNQAMTEIASLADRSLPKADETYAALSRAYALGRIPYSNLREGGRLLISLRQELNDARLNARHIRIEIERILGLNLDQQDTSER